jgi:hypothetical protein
VNRTRAIVVVAVWALAVLALQVSGARPAPLIIGGIVAALAGLVFATRDLFRSARTVTWSRRSPGVRFTRRNDPRVSSLRRQFTGTNWQGSSELNDTLIDLVDDRLAAHHGIDRAIDPVASDIMLAPSLRHLVAEPDRPLSGVRELRRIVTDIEAL